MFNARTEPIQAICGISRIWVSRQYRRRGIATKLLDFVRLSFASVYRDASCGTDTLAFIIRKNYIYGCCLDRSAIAFSQPTGDGKALATIYTGTSEFLAYTEEV